MNMTVRQSNIEKVMTALMTTNTKFTLVEYTLTYDGEWAMVIEVDTKENSVFYNMLVEADLM